MQILLDEDRYRRLEELASESGRSVASVIRDAIDAKFGDDEMARRRLEAGRRFLSAPYPPGDGPEPDWEGVGDLEADEEFEGMYRDAS
jgi:Ribbon-helix-helix protein, copG family